MRTRRLRAITLVARSTTRSDHVAARTSPLAGSEALTA
jgi:hypothetical protein